MKTPADQYEAVLKSSLIILQEDGLDKSLEYLFTSLQRFHEDCASKEDVSQPSN